MESIISDLFVSDESLKRKASLRVVFEQPDAILRICEILVTSEKPEIRQYAAALLGKHIDNLDNWQAVPLGQQAHIKQCTLNTILVETQKTVRAAMAKTICVLAKHEFYKNDEWRNEVLRIIFDFTLSDDAHKSELGASLFKTFTDTAPNELIIPYIEPICEMFSAVMICAAESGDIGTPVILNILLGMRNLVPFILGRKGARAVYQKSVPYVIKALQSFALQDPDHFIGAFDILEMMAEATPRLLTPHLDNLVEFSLATGSNNLFQNQIRVGVVPFIGGLVKFNKKAILKNNLLDRIVGGVFVLMGTHSEGGDSDEDDYFSENENLNPRINATHTMGLLAVHVPPQKLIPQLLEYIKLAVENPDPNQKKAAQLCLAVIATGCSKASCAKYFNLEYMFNCIKTGLVDPLPLVRKAAVFALGKFSKHLQTDVSKFAKDILPIWFDLLQQLCNQIRSGVSVINIDRTFYSLEPYIENLEDDILPHLPVLMERIFEILRPEIAVHLRKFGMSSLASVSKSAKKQMLPYFEKIMDILKVYLVQSNNEEIIEIQLEVIDTIAVLARTIGKEIFMPLTDDIITFALIRLKNAHDPILRSGLYNLFGVLAQVKFAKIAPVLKQIVEPMLNAIKLTENILPELKEHDADNDESMEDIDIDDDDEDEVDEDKGVEEASDESEEQAEAVWALKLLAEFGGPEFVPFISTSFEYIFKQLDNSNTDMRVMALEALVQFITSLNQNNDDADVQNKVAVFVPKMAKMIANDSVFEVVFAALRSYGMLLRALKQEFFTEKLKKTIFKCIKKVLNSKVSCQLYDDKGEVPQKKENNEELLKAAGDLLPKFGFALGPDEFSTYFKQIVPILEDKIESSKAERNFAYATLSECLHPLQNHLGEYFETFLPGYLHGIRDDVIRVRQNYMYGLGKLVLYSGEVAYDKFPLIMDALSEAWALEKHPKTLDYICGAFARLIMANFKIISLEKFLPVFVQKLPLRECFAENLTIFNCFTTLWEQQPESLCLVLDSVIMVGMHVLLKMQYKGDEPRIVIQNLLQHIRWRFSDRFNQVVNRDPEIEQFVQTW